MTLKEFAKQCGVEVLIDCDVCWGGKYGWRLIGKSSITVRGYKTEAAAIKGWMREHFGNKAAKVILNMLSKARNR